MKKYGITTVFTLIALFVCSLTMNAVSPPRNYIHDTKEENGKVISKTIFLNEDGLLSKEVKYEFTYYDSGKVAEKKAYRWNSRKNDWTPFYRTTFTYNTETGEIHSVYGIWNGKANEYNLNVQEIDLPASDYENIFS
ncbi:DUF3836 domain-containing protein [Parabacteroides sp. Marseille-P3160]|uniref:DUF3836 domain-containing protein n=1 Tax=Parabacteroides sp. Marseille-P3160 TaxID=1917887 RepID=UPI0009BB30DC|nr:DUF3836 domain-containing protein [Parabacteroides sp. Marseille-P3160]